MPVRAHSFLGLRSRGHMGRASMLYGHSAFIRSLPECTRPSLLISIRLSIVARSEGLPLKLTKLPMSRRTVLGQPQTSSYRRMSHVTDEARSRRPKLKCTTCSGCNQLSNLGGQKMKGTKNAQSVFFELSELGLIAFQRLTSNGVN